MTRIFVATAINPASVAGGTETPAVALHFCTKAVCFVIENIATFASAL